jgi:hypothetical protein
MNIFGACSRIANRYGPLNSIVFLQRKLGLTLGFIQFRDLAAALLGADDTLDLVQ